MFKSESSELSMTGADVLCFSVPKFKNHQALLFTGKASGSTSGHFVITLSDNHSGKPFVHVISQFETKEVIAVTEDISDE